MICIDKRINMLKIISSLLLKNGYTDCTMKHVPFIESLEIDSILFVTLIVEIERALGVEFSDNVFMFRSKTIGQLLDVLEKEV